MPTLWPGSRNRSAYQWTSSTKHEELSYQAALSYAARGWSVLPVGRDKRPLLAWAPYQQRRAGEGEIQSWWRRWSEAGVGIVCGVVSGGLVVLDVDPRNGGADSLDALVAEYGELPPSPIARTGGGGTHYYFLAPGQASVHGVRPGLDLQSNGTYVVAPPSAHPSGQRYEWLLAPESSPLPQLPAWLATIASDRPRTPAIVSPAAIPVTLGRRALDFVANGAPSGEQRLRAVAAARNYLSAGRGVEETIDAIWRGLQASPVADPERPWALQDAENIVRDLSTRPAPPLRPQPPGAMAPVDEHFWDSILHDETLDSPPQSEPPDNGRRPREAVEETGEEYRLTDVGNARRLVHRHGQDLRYCYPWHSWLVWTGQRWSPDDTGEVERRAKAVVHAMFQEAAELMQRAAPIKSQGDNAQADRLSTNATELWKHAKRSEQAPRIVAMLQMAESEPGIPIGPDDLDRDPWLLNCQTGTIDLRSGALMPHRRNQYLTKLCPVAFTPHATLPLWERFLNEAIPDAETRDYVQRCAGATIVGRADDDLLLVCHGEGGTGKGTFLNALQRTLGDYGASAELETFTTKHDPHAPQPDLARLRGRRMVAISEVDTGGTVSLLKRATGGDPILTRSHHQESFEFIPQFTLWIICNERPRVPDNDSGIWRRLREIPFVTKFAAPDPTIRQQLSDPAIAGAAVLAWAVQGCLAWQRQGVGRPPPPIEAATTDYRREMDPLADWLDDCCQAHTGVATYGVALWQSYRGWAKATNLRHPLGRKGFAQRMGQSYGSKKTEKGVAYIGLTLRGDPLIMSTQPGDPDTEAG